MEPDYSRLPERSFLCVDMKSFYASIEAVDRGRNPLTCHLAVIGDKQRSGSVVLAASPAMKKKYGIHTGNRHYEIPKRNEIEVVEARMGLYLEKSLAVTRIFTQYVPPDAVHVYSVDEAWLKLDGTELLFGQKKKNAAEGIRRELKDKLGLPCSMGLGPNMFLAKVAMDTEGKKKGLAVWEYEDVPQKLWPLPVGKCWGIGKRLETRLHNMGVKTVGDIAHFSLDSLEREFGIMGNQLYHHAWGIDLSEPGPDYTRRPRSLGRGITLLRDYRSKEEVKTVILELCDEVAGRARREGLAGRTVSLGLGYSRDEREAGFHRQRTVPDPLNLVGDIYTVCLQLLDEYYAGQEVRHIGVSLSNLVVDAAVQLDLSGRRKKMLDLARAIDKIRDKYGRDAILRARSLKEEGTARERSTKIGGHQA